MPRWRWANLRVLDEWAEGRSDQERTAVYRAMMAAMESDTLPGRPVLAPPGRLRRVIETEAATIKFAPPEDMWNAAHDCLFLLEIN